jgi:cytochrome P450
MQRCANILAQNVPHVTTQDVNIAGFHLPPGTLISPQISCVHMDETYFPSPQLFNPDRFLQPDGNLKKVGMNFI